jgi:hypothetical protein
LSKKSVQKPALQRQASFHFTVSPTILKALDEYFLTAEERRYIDYINKTFESNTKISQLLPIGYTGSQVASALVDGVILCNLINKAVPGTIDERVIKVKSRSLDEMTGNHNLLTNSAIGVGISPQTVVNSLDLTEGKVERIMKFVSELIEVIFLAHVTLDEHPELKYLMKKDEELGDYMRCLPDEYLLRWVNYHLKNAKYDKQITNFGADLKVYKSSFYTK